MVVRDGSLQSNDGCKWLKLLKNCLFSSSALSTSVVNSTSSQDVRMYSSCIHPRMFKDLLSMYGPYHCLLSSWRLCSTFV